MMMLVVAVRMQLIEYLTCLQLTMLKKMMMMMQIV